MHEKELKKLAGLVDDPLNDALNIIRAGLNEEFLCVAMVGLSPSGLSVCGTGTESKVWALLRLVLDVRDEGGMDGQEPEATQH